MVVTLTGAACGGGSGGGADTDDRVTGRWLGTGTYAERNSPCNGEATIVLDFLQTGVQLTGNLTGRVTRASETCLAAAGQSLSGPLNGTVAGSTLTFTVEGPVQFTGTRAGNRIQGMFAGLFQGLIDVSGQWTVDKQ